MNVGRRNNDLFGLQTAAITTGGIGTPGTSNIATSEEYDGTTWSSTASLSTATSTSRGSGSTTAGFTAGGASPSSTSVTEEYNKAPNSFVAAAWASGGNMNTARSYLSGSTSGSQTASLIFGGNSTPNGQMANSESYNGS